MLRIAIIAERIAAEPWHPMRLAHDVAFSLSRRGHEVVIVCESFDPDAIGDAAAFPSTLRVSPRTGYCHRAGVRAGAFISHARGHAAEIESSGGVAISFSTLVPATVWTPIAHMEPIADTRFDDAVHEYLLLKGTRRRVREWAAAAFDVSHVRRLLVFAPRTHRPRSPIDALSGRAINVGHVSTVTPPAAEEAHALRRTTRRLLGIEPARRAILVSPDGRSWSESAGLMGAVAHLHRQRRPDAPTLLIAAHEPIAANLAAARAGLANIPAAVRIARTTSRPEALLSAADIVAIPHRAADRPIGGPARLLCDALRMGKPVIAARSAPGAPLIDAALRAGDGARVPGLLVSDETPAAWYRALVEALSPDHRAAFPAPDATATQRGPASAAARALADLHGLDLESFTDRIERVVAQVGAAQQAAVHP